MREFFNKVTSYKQGGGILLFVKVQSISLKKICINVYT